MSPFGALLVALAAVAPEPTLLALCREAPETKALRVELLSALPPSNDVDATPFEELAKRTWFTPGATEPVRFASPQQVAWIGADGSGQGRRVILGPCTVRGTAYATRGLAAHSGTFGGIRVERGTGTAKNVFDDSTITYRTVRIGSYAAGASEGAGADTVEDVALFQFRDGAHVAVVIRYTWFEDGHAVRIDTIELVGRKVTVHTREPWGGMY